jgi:hypothetical protein
MSQVRAGSLFIQRVTRIAILAPFVIAACSERQATSPAEPLAAPAASLLTGTGRLAVTVLRPDGTPAADAAVVVVEPVAGPIRTVLTGSDGVASFNDLPAGNFCVHARVDVSAAAAGLALFPAEDPAGLGVTRSGHAAAISGKGRDKSPALSYGTYKACLADPPVSVKNAAVSLTLSLKPGATLDLSLLDLNGDPLSSSMHAGIVTPFGSCAEYPWLATSSVCSDDQAILPGFLHSVNTVASPALLTVPQGQDYVIEALQTVLGQGALTFTKKDNAKATGTQLEPLALQLEPLLCEVDKWEEPVGDGGTIDIGDATAPGLIGYVKHGIQAAYPNLDPDPSQVAVWWEQSGTGSMTFDSRTRTGSGTHTSTLNFDVAWAGDDVACTVTSSSALPGLNESTFSVYCAPAGEGRVRVTVRQENIAAWVGHEFSIRGGGDVVPNASRENATSAFVPVQPRSTCSVQLTNDDRWAVVL